MKKWVVMVIIEESIEISILGFILNKWMKAEAKATHKKISIQT